MKRTIAIILGVCIVVMLAGCGAAASPEATAPSNVAPPASNSSSAAAQPAVTTPPAANPIEKYPEKAMTFTIPYAAGGSSDMLLRFMATVLPNYLEGASPVIQCLPGGASIPGTLAVKDAPNDGYHMGQNNTATWATRPWLYPDEATYTLDDFTYICSVATQYVAIFVSASSPFQTVSDLFAYAEANPGSLVYTGGISGSGQEVLIEWIKYVGGYDMVNMSTSGDAETLTNVINGTIDFGVMNTAGGLWDYYENGDVRILCMLGTNRCDKAPDVPAISEELPQFGECYINYDSVLYMPAGVDEEIVSLLRDVFYQVFNDETFQMLCKKQGIDLLWKEADQWYEETKTAYEAMGDVLLKIYGD